MPRTPAAPAPATTGDRLRAARVAAGLTQVQAAALAGVGQSFLSDLERGRWAASLEWLCDYAAAIGADPHDLDPRLRSNRGA